MAKRILLSGVFGPFGVDDAFGRKENIMELFHNQVTKAQGIASPRYHHRSFGLYFLAENVQAPVTVLDFPTRGEFIRTLKRERFDAVGISFIVPNFVKAREMARLVRKHQPGAEIILGGHGASIEGIEQLIDCDHVARGEGIRWLRRYLGEDENAPVRHPALPASEDKRVYGIPTPGVGALLVPGVGCVNGCRFCCTSHFFSKEYTPFFGKGEELYRNAVRVSEELGSDDDFLVMDENFLKSRERAQELLACMERDQKPMQFFIFSSAEAITAFGIENMVRLGITVVWLGAESRREVYEKNKGLDLKALIRKLRDHGIAVLVSGILFLEHHTKENIQDDIDYIIDLGGDFTQFMQFTPMPGTRLYHQLKQEGRIDFDLPFEEWHGQNLLNWRHPHFTREEASRILNDAFRLEFDRNSASSYRMADTALRGYEALLSKTSDRWLWLRREQMRARAEELRLLMPTMKRFAHNDLARERVEALGERFVQVLGREPLHRAALAVGARALAEANAAKALLGADYMQPRMHRVRYRWPLDPVEQRAADLVQGLRQRATAALGRRYPEPV